MLIQQMFCFLLEIEPNKNPELHQAHQTLAPCPGVKQQPGPIEGKISQVTAPEPPHGLKADAIIILHGLDP